MEFSINLLISLAIGVAIFLIIGFMIQNYSGNIESFVLGVFP